jgi:LysM repeat protein
MCRKGFIAIVMLFVFSFSFGQNNNSKTAPKTTKYIMHVVKFGETLTKIAKKYGVSTSDILKINPSLTADNLNPEQILRIPNLNNKKVLTNSDSESYKQIPVVEVKPNLKPKSGHLHTVEHGQTIYGISKMYGVKVDEIQKWNQLTDYNIKIGSQLIVADPAKMKSDITPIAESLKVKPNQSETINKLPEKKTEPQKQVEPPKETLESENDESETQKPDIQASEKGNQKELIKLFKDKAAGSKIIVTKGTGAPMTTTLGAMETVYFAMHKSLPIGTIIKIKNLVNSKIIYAKVIGKLPETDENKHVIVRYSLGVKKDLQLQNGKCYVQVEFPE